MVKIETRQKAFGNLKYAQQTENIQQQWWSSWVYVFDAVNININQKEFLIYDM